MRARDIDAIPLPPCPDIEQYEKRTKALIDAVESDDPSAIRRWAEDWLESLAKHVREKSSHERWANDEAEQLVKEIGEHQIHLLADAQLYIAQIHGFDSWPKFSGHLADIARQSPVSDFEAAVDAIVTGDIETLRALIEKHPSLVRTRSSRVHHATLLHYLAANGHEGYRQKTPKNALEIARLLLSAGAEVDATAHMYGGASTTMEMLVSSSPPAKAGLQVALVETLLEYGAAPDGIGNDSSPIMTALSFRYPDSARALARHGARVDNVISAAALGRVDLVEQMVSDQGTLEPRVPLVPVRWPRIERDPAKHLAYALAYATWCGEKKVVEVLLRKGVDPNSSDNDGPALSWATGIGRMDLARLLLSYGADLEKLNTYGGNVLSATLWFAFNAPTKGVDYAVVIGELIALGANVDYFPELRDRIEEVRRKFRPAADRALRSRADPTTP
jgi:ankyrin repeat protein